MEPAVYISIFKVTVLPFLHWLLVDLVVQVVRHIPGGKKLVMSFGIVALC